MAHAIRLKQDSIAKNVQTQVFILMSMRAFTRRAKICGRHSSGSGFHLTEVLSAGKPAEHNAR